MVDDNELIASAAAANSESAGAVYAAEHPHPAMQLLPAAVCALPVAVAALEAVAAARAAESAVPAPGCVMGATVAAVAPAAAAAMAHVDAAAPTGPCPQLGRCAQALAAAGGAAEARTASGVGQEWQPWLRPRACHIGQPDAASSPATSGDLAGGGTARNRCLRRGPAKEPPMPTGPACFPHRVVKLDHLEAINLYQIGSRIDNLCA